MNLNLKNSIQDMNLPVLLDGGHSNVLESWGYDLNHPLWSAKFLLEDPELIKKVHKAYLESGAKVITTFSYQASISGMIRLGYTEDDAKTAILKSVDLAVEAREAYFRASGSTEPIMIAASIGPYGASLADGSEYRGNYGVTEQELADFHKEKIEILAQSKADLLAFETIPSYKEAIVISRITKDIQAPSWISFSCMDGQNINDGTPIKKCAELLKDHPTIFAIGINCTSPQHVNELIRILANNVGRKNIIIYPNAGNNFDPEIKKWSRLKVDKSFYECILDWLHLGASIIGGCCQVGPEEIRAMRSMIDEQKEGHQN